MRKTDKELAIELSCAFIQGWNSNESVTPVNIDELTDVVKAAYKAVISITDEN